jgi:hypothetical protein
MSEVAAEGRSKFNIVAYLIKATTVKLAETAVATEWLWKHAHCWANDSKYATMG